jgi:hypothetical protein
MTFLKQIGGAAALGVAMLGSGLSAPPAQAAYIVTLAQAGSNVVATGSGTIDLAGLFRRAEAIVAASISPTTGLIVTGPASGELVNVYTGFTGPASFGSGGTTFASSGSEDTVGIGDSDNFLAVPAGYVSGSPLADSATYDNQTFSSLGVTPGVYVWTWASDSFTLDIPAVAVPEPSGLGLLALPLGLVMLLATRHRRATREA